MWRALSALTAPIDPLKPKACRRTVKRRLELLAVTQTYPVSSDAQANMAGIAGQCANCGACPKFAASIAFMLLRPVARSRLRQVDRSAGPPP